MLICLMKWDIRHEKEDAYLEWAKMAVRRLLDVPGCVEFRALRAIMGGQHVVVTFEFPNLKAWASWYEHEDTQKVFDEGRPLMTNATMELLGPSPVAPERVRLG